VKEKPVQTARVSLCARRALCRITTALMVTMVLVGATAAEAATIKKVAVIMFKPQNYGTAWVDRTTVLNTVWGSTNSARAYYEEESYGRWTLQGKLSVSGDVWGWFTVPYSDTGKCVSALWVSDAQAKAAATGFVASNYDSVIFVTTATGCAGRAWTSGKYITIVSGFNAPTVMHELGHSYGLSHASAWMCKDLLGLKVSISSSCTVSEYGDYPVMGATTSYHMNNFQKGALGFLVASNTKDVTTTGVYNLYPTETLTSNVQVLRIPRKYDSYGTVLDYYYLEFRKTFGFDKFSLTSPYVTGVSIRVAPGYTVKGSRSYLIDATTPALTGFSDAPLGLAGTFTDPTRRVSITLLSILNGAAQVSVAFF
jgi:hypothetical protein